MSLRFTCSRNFYRIMTDPRLLASLAIVSALSCATVPDNPDGNDVDSRDNEVDECGCVPDAENHSVPLGPISPYAVVPFDGGTLVAGEVRNEAYESDGAFAKVAVAKIMADGQLDTTFGHDGYAILDVDGDYGDRQIHSAAITIDDQGRILVAGNAGWNHVGLGRFLADGTPDTTFGDPVHPAASLRRGTSSLDFHDKLQAIRSIATMSDGRIVVGGSGWSMDHDFLVARLSAAGELDPSFGDATTPGWFNRPRLGEQTAFGIFASRDKVTFAGGWGFSMSTVDTDNNLVIDSVVPPSNDIYGGDARHVVFDADGAATLVGTSNWGSIGIAKFDSNSVAAPNFGELGGAATAFPDLSDMPAYCCVESSVLGVANTGDATYVYTRTRTRMYVTKFWSDGSVAKDYADNGSYQLMGPRWSERDTCNGLEVQFRRGNLLAATPTHLLAFGIDTGNSHDDEDIDQYAPFVAKAPR